MNLLVTALMVAITVLGWSALVAFVAYWSGVTRGQDESEHLVIAARMEASDMRRQRDAARQRHPAGKQITPDLYVIEGGGEAS